MPHRFLFAMLLALAVPSALAADPAAADIDRLLKIMQVEKQIGGMEQQMTQAQEATIFAAFGKDGSEADRASMREMMARTQAKVSQHMSWPVLAPIMRKVYAEMYTQQEVEAMLAFYGSPTGAEILRKNPQVSMRMMQEMQPIMQVMLSETKQELEAKLSRPKP